MKKILALTLTVGLSLVSLLAADFDIRIPSEFKKIVASDAKVKKLAGGMVYTEGPVWVSGATYPSGVNGSTSGTNDDYLIFSNIPGNELKRWNERDGLTVFRKDTHSGNGNTIDHEGRLLTCEMVGRRIVRLEKDGALNTIVDSFEGKKFNAPNDVVVKSDNSIWFSDPDYGLSKPRELPGLYVYRLDQATKKFTVMVKDCDHPNGLCFSSDEKKLYVADSGPDHLIRVYDMQKDGTPANGRVFCVIDNGVPDGIRCDHDGRVFSSSDDGIQIFDTKGRLIAKILVPESPANLAFGGKNGKTLFITARSSLYSIPVLVTGAP